MYREGLLSQRVGNFYRFELEPKWQESVKPENNNLIWSRPEGMALGPFRTKNKTKTTIIKAKGLKPLPKTRPIGASYCPTLWCESAVGGGMPPDGANLCPPWPPYKNSL